MAETILCIGTTEFPLYEGTTFPSSNTSDILLYTVAYQIDLAKDSATWSDRTLRATIEVPARLPELLRSLNSGEIINYRLVVRDVDPLDGGAMKIFSTFTGTAKIKQLIPHSPNSRSPINSGFSQMADLTLNLNNLTITEDYEVNGSSSVNFEGAGA